jgi:hypothetical protein
VFIHYLKGILELYLLYRWRGAFAAFVEQSERSTERSKHRAVRTNYSVKYHFAPNLFKIGVRCFSGGKKAEQANALVNPRDTQSFIRNGELKQLNSAMLKKASQVYAFSTINHGKLSRSQYPALKPQSNLDLTNKAE